MSTVKVKSTTVDFDPLRNPDMFKFGGNPEKKKVVKKAVVAKKEVKATPKKGAGEAKKKPPAPKPQPEPEPEEEEEEEDIFGAAANEGEGSIPKSFLDGAPVATSSSDKDPFAEGKADEQETGGLQDVYIPKEAMEKRNNELKAEALDEDLVNMGDDADLAKFDSQNEDGKKLVIEPLPDSITTEAATADPQNDAIDDDLFNMVDGGAGGGGGAEEGGLDISKYIAQNDKGASDDLFS